MALATVLKGLPLAYDRDLQEDKPALFAAVENALESIRAAELLVERLEFDRERLASAASDPGLMATDAAEELVRTGVPFRKAHETVGKQVREGKFAAPWKARASLSRRNLPGGPNPGRVAARARAIRREAAVWRRWSARRPPPFPK
jgi:argininosuccinate lyase